MPSDVVIALRKQLREKFPSAHPVERGLPDSRPADPPSARFPSGTRAFPKGSITEISPSSPSCGLSLVVAALLARDEADGDAPNPGLPLVLIDARDRFDPACLTPEECSRLLWLRCGDTAQALRAADLLLRDGNLPFVLLDLTALPTRELRRIPGSSWHRLRQLAESTGSSLLALTPSPLIPRTALRLSLTRTLTLDDLILSRSELLTLLETQTTRHLHHTRSA